VEPGHAGHLEYFYEAYREQLDGFVAQFEPVPHQVGAVVLVDGKVAGVERAPSSAYFASVWRPLLRDCYGALAAVLDRQGRAARPPRTRAPLRKASSLDDLGAALAEADAEEYDRVAALVTNVAALTVEVTPEERVQEFQVEGLTGRSFVGQAVRDGEKVLYASLVASSTWQQHEDWLTARPFAMPRRR
jgi:hypothetical protein